MTLTTAGEYRAVGSFGVQTHSKVGGPRASRYACVARRIDPAEIHRFAAWGLDGLMSDYPERIAKG